MHRGWGGEVCGGAGWGGVLLPAAQGAEEQRGLFPSCCWARLGDAARLHSAEHLGVDERRPRIKH